MSNIAKYARFDNRKKLWSKKKTKFSKKIKAADRYKKAFKSIF